MWSVHDGPRDWFKLDWFREEHAMMLANRVGVTMCCLVLVAGCGSAGSTKTSPPGSTSIPSGSSGQVQASSPATSAAPVVSVASAAPVVACDIVKKADVEAAFGGTSTQGAPGKTPAYCDFTLTGTLKSGKAVEVLGATVGVSWNSKPLDPNSKVLNAAATKVPELGVAFYESLGNALFLSYHGGALRYQAHGPDDDQVMQANLIALAKATYQR